MALTKALLAMADFKNEHVQITFSQEIPQQEKENGKLFRGITTLLKYYLRGSQLNASIHICIYIQDPGTEKIN